MDDPDVVAQMQAGQWYRLVLAHPAQVDEGHGGVLAKIVAKP